MRDRPTVTAGGIEAGCAARHIAAQGSDLNIKRVAGIGADHQSATLDLHQAPARIASRHSGCVVDVPDVVASASEGQRAIIGQSSDGPQEWVDRAVDDCRANHRAEAGQGLGAADGESADAAGVEARAGGNADSRAVSNRVAGGQGEGAVADRRAADVAERVVKGLRAGADFDQAKRLASATVGGHAMEHPAGIVGAGKWLSLVKIGTGTQTFYNALGHIGSTTVSNGGPALAAGSSITNSPRISVASGASFDASGGSRVAVGSAQTLAGLGAGRSASINSRDPTDSWGPSEL